MMSNLFMVFDPVSILGLQLNWISVFIGLIFLPFGFWGISSRILFLYEEITGVLSKEVGFLYSSKWGGVELFLVSLFWFIVMSNFLGLFPFIFTATSHILVTLALALPFWLSLMLYGWCRKTVEMMAHLVPLGTPFALMNFMVLIETVSNMIRPVTLSVRLAANMIAGHLLIVLLGSVVSLKIWSLGVGIFSLSLLFVLELAVSVIQSYVFMVLVGLYSAEI